MGMYYLGQIMMTGFGYGQRGFAQCNAQLLGIAQNQALFSLLGTTYGGDGVQTFALPDLRGRTPVGYGNSATVPSGYPEGLIAGVENVTIGLPQMATHNHPFTANTGVGDVTAPTVPTLYATATIAGGGTEMIYAPPTAGPDVALLPATIGMTGGNQPHSNMQPYEVINFNVALTGIYPSRS